jgi:hypothetical protein
MSNDFSMNAGDTKLISFPILDVNGDPVEISEAVAVWKLSKSNVGTKKTPLKVRTSDDGGILLTNVDENGVTIVLNPSDTNDLNGEYYHEIRVIVNSVQESWWGKATIHGTTTYEGG